MKSTNFWEDHNGFQTKLDRVVDGDTMDITADLGFRARYEARIRLVGVDTAEVYGVGKETDEYARGMEHAEWAFQWFEENRGTRYEWPFVVDTGQDTDMYGRWPAVVKSKATGNVLNTDIVQAFPDVEYTNGDT